MLSVAKVHKTTVFKASDDLTREPDAGEEDFDDAFPRPSTQAFRATTAAAGYGKCQRGTIGAATSVITDVSNPNVNGPPQGESDEETTRQGVTSERAHDGEQLRLVNKMIGFSKNSMFMSFSVNVLLSLCPS